MRSERLIVALDVSSEADAKALVKQLKKDVSIFKVGLQLFTLAGPSVIKAIQRSDHKVFLDLKLHDIPTTVAKATMEATKLGVSMLTVHALGGQEMMERAVEASHDTAEKLGLQRPLIVAVTIPTSRQDIREIGIQSSIDDMVIRLARLAQEAGCDGIVCSPREIRAVREACGPDFLIVTPGIRLGSDEADDQKRIDTPKTAFEQGASYIVVGRPILRAADPVAAVHRISASVHGLEMPVAPVEPPTPPAESEAAATVEPATEPASEKPDASIS